MCPHPQMSMNWEYVRDLQRRRGYERFYRLEKFAHKRWLATKDMRRAWQWLAVMDSIKRRMPQ